MEGYRFLVVCCVLVITICKLGGADDNAIIGYKITESKTADQGTNVSINFALMVPIKIFDEQSVDLSFTVKTLNLAFTIDNVDPKKVPINKRIGPDTMNDYNKYSGDFEVEVSVTYDADVVLTGDLSVKLSCDHSLCKDNDKIEVIVKETKTLHVTATPSYDVSQTSPTANVTVTLSKDLATPENITLSVSLHDKDPQGKNYSSERVLASDADNSSFPVVFTNIQWGDYQLTIDCGNDSVCSALSQWIQFPEPVSVPAHPSHSELGATIFGLKEQLTDYAANYITLKDEFVTFKANYDTHTFENMVSALRKELTNKIGEALNSNGTKVNCDPPLTLSPTTSTTTDDVAIVPTPSSTTTDDVTAAPVESTEATNSLSLSPTPPPPATTTPSTRYMEFAVGGLIAALVCGLLGYLLYHYRTKVKEWICSKKVVVSNLPIARKLRRNAGSRYSKLPRTMQEALHQD